ncbi:aldehyde dehydrogenase family protein [Chitinophaga sedimenti]|uniref:aldehyde dehydrogenase family protein n=1 Tax=Chitinophaga sedimenti TaxID=2033606 RepID=UPI0020031E48|nr:aldehyde dehydrogenase family protein [Chitinophaga sedimenti]MCK7558953.1 aldehyde dehydrogenase family protein [Chitinophaga sedimenti]
MEYTIQRYEAQRAWFAAGHTRSYEFRREQLLRLKSAILTYESRILEAMAADLHKHPVEAYSSEVGLLYAEIGHTVKHLRKWMRPERAASPLLQFPTRSWMVKEPLGLTLIVAPWNYPFQLVMAPLIAAMAAGNCALLKPSELAPHTEAVITDMIRANFDPAYIDVVTGEGHVVIPQLMQRRYDHVLFTGSTTVGKQIMAMAAPHLTPVTLELGGKSPCIVDDTADIAVAAKRIAWGKFWNAGQTCIAPDYVLVHESVKQQLIEGLQAAITSFFGADPLQSPDYSRIINQKRFDALLPYLAEGTVVHGGQHDREQCYIAPTLLTNIAEGAKVMAEEIFGPVLPVIAYTDAQQAKALIEQHPYPLSLYLFSKIKPVKKYLRIVSRLAAVA